MSEQSNERVIDALRLTDRDRESIVESMEQQSQNFGGKNLRRDMRIPYTLVKSISITVHHPGGSVIVYQVVPRTISRTGFGILHGNFIYPGTQVELPLTSVNGQSVRLWGKVVRCRLVRGRVHEVGVRFDRPIKLADYLPMGTFPPEADCAPAAPAPRTSQRTVR